MNRCFVVVVVVVVFTPTFAKWAPRGIATPWPLDDDDNCCHFVLVIIIIIIIIAKTFNQVRVPLRRPPRPVPPSRQPPIVVAKIFGNIGIVVGGGRHHHHHTHHTHRRTDS